jgi:hypothetical protein
LQATVHDLMLTILYHAICKFAPPRTQFIRPAVRSASSMTFRTPSAGFAEDRGPSSPRSVPIVQDRWKFCAVLARSFLAPILNRCQAPEAGNALRRGDVGIEHIRSDRATSARTEVLAAVTSQDLWG